jgi:hypothetical protein
MRAGPSGFLEKAYWRSWKKFSFMKSQVWLKDQVYGAGPEDAIEHTAT